MKEVLVKNPYSFERFLKKARRDAWLLPENLV
jgi:hypothetical protein